MASDVPAVTTAVRILERLAKAWPDAVAPGVLVRRCADLITLRTGGVVPALSIR